MPIFLCRFPNGDFSVVHAANKDDAIEFLDEVANAEGCPVEAIKNFMVHFHLTDNGEFELENYGEATSDQIMRIGYPVLQKAFLSMGQVGVLAKEDRKNIRKAVAVERGCVVPKEVKEPKNAGGTHDKSRI